MAHRAQVALEPHDSRTSQKAPASLENVEFWVSTDVRKSIRFLQELDDSVTEKTSLRKRYPPRALALMAGVALLCIAEIAVMAVLWLPLIWLLPLFFAAMVGQGFVLASAVEYIGSVARTESAPRAEPKPRREPPSAPETRRAESG